MPGRFRFAFALIAAVVALGPAPHAADLPAVRTVTAVRSPALEARVVSGSYVVAPNAREGAPPAIRGGSGLARVGRWTFVAQDDSTLLGAIADDGRIETVRLFEPIDGADRFHVALKNKKVKPDLESITRISVPRAEAAALSGVRQRAHAVDALLLLGSGSTPDFRDRVAVVFPAAPLSRCRVAAVRPRALYARLRADREFVADGQLNIEGLAVVLGGRFVRIFNRGNGTAGSATSSVDVAAPALLSYLSRARENPDAPFDVPLENPMRYDLGTSNGVPIAIGDAITLPPGRHSGEMILAACVAEATTDANEDGAISGTTLALQLPDGTMLATPVMGVNNLAALKIEGLAVRSAVWRDGRLRLKITGVVDPDSPDPASPSVIVELVVTYDPARA
jgi:hypothetical protein